MEQSHEDRRNRVRFAIDAAIAVAEEQNQFGDLVLLTLVDRAVQRWTDDDWRRVADVPTMQVLADLVEGVVAEYCPRAVGRAAGE